MNTKPLQRKQGLTRSEALIGTPMGFTPSEKPNFRKPLRKRRKGTLNKKRNTSVSKAKAKAWKACSLYVRKRDMNSMGMVDCYTCSKRLFWKDADAGHGIAGRGNAILFKEEIIRPQCKGCNVFQHGRLDIFMAKLIKELGQKKIDEFLLLKGTVNKMSVEAYEEIEKLYTEKMNQL